MADEISSRRTNHATEVKRINLKKLGVMGTSIFEAKFKSSRALRLIPTCRPLIRPPAGRPAHLSTVVVAVRPVAVADALDLSTVVRD